MVVKKLVDLDENIKLSFIGKKTQCYEFYTDDESTMVRVVADKTFGDWVYMTQCTEGLTLSDQQKELEKDSTVWLKNNLEISLSDKLLLVITRGCLNRQDVYNYIVRSLLEFGYPTRKSNMFAVKNTNMVFTMLNCKSNE